VEATLSTRRAIGKTALQVSPICLGTSPLASLPSLYGYEVGEDQAVATLRATFKSPINFIDTSNGYGGGAAERFLGKAIRELGGLPSGVVLATKVDADPITRDFSGDRVRRSAEESLERLGLEHFQLLHLHDPEYYMTFAEAMKPGGPVEALVSLREQGLAGDIGIAAGPIPMLLDFVRTGLFSVVLSHNRYTLLDRSAEPLMREAEQRGVAYLNAAPYGGGFIAKPAGEQSRYAYRPAKPGVLVAADAIRRVCAAHDVPVMAAALQFSLRDPRIASTVVGFSRSSRVEETLRLATFPIPEALWPELRRLTPPEAEWLH
jgi:D-threo-aldose 1-dehydrogenase